MGFQEDTHRSRRDKLKQIIQTMEQTIPSNKPRGRPRAPLYPDYLSKLTQDVVVEEDDDQCCGFSESDLPHADSKLTKLQEIIRSMQEELDDQETPFYGFDESQVHQAKLDHNKLCKAIEDVSNETVNVRFNQQLHYKSKLNRNYPWDYQQWLQILENDLFEEPQPCTKHQPDITVSEIDVLSDIDSIVVDSPSFDDTEFTFHSPSVPEDVIVSEIHNLHSPLLDEYNQQRMSTPIRPILRSETDPLCLDRIPVLSSSESSLEFHFEDVETMATLNPLHTVQELHICENTDAVFPTQRQAEQDLQFAIQLDKVVNVQAMLDTAHRISPSLQPIQPGKVYNLEPILEDIQPGLEAAGRPIRTRKKHDYKRLNSEGFDPRN